jgi:hypothetical protein
MFPASSGHKSLGQRPTASVVTFLGADGCAAAERAAKAMGSVALSR